MRVLVVFPHYYRPEEAPEYSSTDIGRKGARRAAIESVFSSWRGHFDVTATLQLHRNVFENTRGAVSRLDLVAVVSGEHHLLDDGLADQFGVKRVAASVDNPRMLPFAAQVVMANSRSSYDWFVYSEDDLRLSDSSFFIKQSAFQAQFGWKRLLCPNRYEFNKNGPRLKTFIDGDLIADFTARFHQALPDEEFIQQDFGGVRVSHRRALNPHSGFFALSAEQLDHWVRQPHFLDLDCSFVSPLESAATLGLLKTFCLYKPFGASAGFLEIEHLDDRFSSRQLKIV